MLFRLLICLALAALPKATVNKSSITRRQISSIRYLPHCKFDENIINNNGLLKSAVDESQIVFSGKVSSNVSLSADNRTIVFSVFVKRFFKGDLPHEKEVKVLKYLNEGEGTKCRQVIRLRYTAIFLARKNEEDGVADVKLTINPVSITLNNLERINAATKGKQTYIISKNFASIKLPFINLFLKNSNLISKRLLKIIFKFGLIKIGSH